jgi:hypothetical protein
MTADWQKMGPPGASDQGDAFSVRRGDHRVAAIFIPMTFAYPDLAFDAEERS